MFFESCPAALGSVLVILEVLLETSDEVGIDVPEDLADVVGNESSDLR